MLDELTPLDLDLPARFADWRPIQKSAIEQVVYGNKRFNALAMPTGSGKSLTVMSIAKITGWRTVILTGTKGLMDQYLREFGLDPRTSTVISRLTGAPRDSSPNQLIDIRGKSNYRCLDMAHLTCDEGRRTGCRYCGTDRCNYNHSLTIARNHTCLVTNYKYHFHINRSGAGLTRAIKPNPIEHLVLDEAHLAPEELAAFLALSVTESEIVSLLHTHPPDSDNIAEWVKWAKEWYDTIKLEMDEYAKHLEKKGRKCTPADLREMKKLESLQDRVDRLRKVKSDGWVCELHRHPKFGKKWTFDPVWPGLFAERTLFLGIPHVTLISATCRPKTAGLLGIKQNELEFKEWPRIFPANRNPIYSIPAQRTDGTEIRINYKVTDADLDKWVERIDEIIDNRLDRKGIIHTVSYARQDYLFAHSRFAHLMIGNTSDPDSPTAAQIVHQFKAAAAPCILVSPSFSTGWDFPDDECEWIIITKIPFPHSKSKVMKERMKRDPQYLSYLAMQDLIQSCGRGMRHDQDRCEVFIVDATISWFLNQNRKLAPGWFATRKMAKVPAAPISLFEEGMR